MRAGYLGPSLENWGSELKSLLWLANSPHTLSKTDVINMLYLLWASSSRTFIEVEDYLLILYYVDRCKNEYEVMIPKVFDNL